MRTQLERGGVLGDEGIVRFEPDLDRGLQRCEDVLLATAGEADDQVGVLDGMPAGLSSYLERVSLPEGTVLLHQDEPPGDVYVLASGRLAVETVTAEGTRIRLRTLRPGVVVGEIAFYTEVPRTADVVAETPCESCGSAADRSRGWRPKIPRWPRPATDGSRARWRND